MDLTPEQTADTEERAAAFLKEWEELYTTLKEKYQCQMIYEVQTVPSPAGVFGLGVVQGVDDLKYKGVISPFMAQDESV